MKSKIIYVIILAVVLSFPKLSINAQNGCDLCGPSLGAYKNVAGGTYSATIGAGCESRGAYSFSVGYIAKSYMPNAIAMGRYVRSQAVNSIVIGSGFNNLESGMLTNNVSNSLMIGFNSKLPTLFVSSSASGNATGKVGIGNVVSPKAKLHVRSDSDEDAGIIVETTNKSKMAYIQFIDEKNRISVNPNSGLSILSQDASINIDASQVQMNAKLTIDIPDTFPEDDYALAVSGGIVTTKVMIKEVSEWPDYVFKDGYKLLSINKVAHYIDKNGHLPDIPSEQDILNNGYDMVEMDGLLLKKIEELTLYAIELNELIESQQKIIESLQSK